MRELFRLSLTVVVRSVALALLAVASCDDPTEPDTSRDVASVVITPDTRTFTAINDSARLSAEAKNPVGGTITDVTFVWSSVEPNVASVDQTGMVKARAAGTARIVASVSGKADTATITVAQTATRLVLSPQADTINAIGDVVAFAATVTDANNVPLTNPTVTWSTTTPTVVSLANGNVTSLATGSGVVIATSGGVADTVTVLSRQIAATLSVAPSPVTLTAGETQQLTATAADSNGVAIPGSAITWSSASQAIASVSGTGVVRGESAGNTTVTAVAPGRTVDVAVTVHPAAPSGPLSWNIVHRGMVVSQPLGILGSSPSDVFFVGSSGIVFRYDGTRWSAGDFGLPGSILLSGFWGASSASIWAAGTEIIPSQTGLPMHGGRVFHTTGSGWTTEYAAPNGTQFYDVHGTSDTDIWVAGTQIFHYDGASWTLSLFSGSTFTAIWAASPTAVFAGTSNGDILHYDGATWTVASTPASSSRVTDIWGLSATDVWAVDEGGVVMHWDGISWQESTRFGAGLSSVRGTSATNVWVGGGVLAHWNGGTWFSLDPATTVINGVRGIWLSSATHGWLITNSGMLSEVRPEGWTPHWDSPSIFTEVSGIGSEAWVCGLPGTVQHLTSGNWRTERLPRSEGCRSITARSTTNVLAGGTTSIYYSYNGAAWSVNPTGAPFGFVDLWTTGGGETYGVAGTTVYRFDGTSWIPMPTGSPQNLQSVWASGPSDIFAAGGQGTVMHYDGTSWTKLTTGTTGNLVSIWGSSPSNVFFVGTDANGGLVLRYNGTDFASSNPTARALRGVHGRSPNEVYAVGDIGTIIRFNGTTWSTEASGVETDLWDVWASAAGDVYAVGFPSLILRGTR